MQLPPQMGKAASRPMAASRFGNAEYRIIETTAAYSKFTTGVTDKEK